jgi:hypothetical protein
LLLLLLLLQTTSLLVAAASQQLTLKPCHQKFWRLVWQQRAACNSCHRYSTT